jgi:hypothetical protein
VSAWFKWGVRIFVILALVMLVAGLVVLALPDEVEGQQLIQLDDTHSVRVADVVGAAMAAGGALLAWVTVLAWQRKTVRG